ncbi:MAG: glycoside hydrolase family 95 protein, partial [Cyclobacteriaceae bacterium]|nr:glycoside hydrolase family 95 protein [Cyclobacteriaceae bacterium]
FLSASTNYLSYKEVSAYPSNRVDEYLSKIEGQSYKSIRERHIADYQQLFNRFILDLGTNAKDTLPVDERIRRFQESPDPQLVSLYVQYGRYLLISSSRSGTNPANLQGIWNKELKPSWDSKYTVNINTEMNYWPAEVTNLSECHDPLFKLIEECAETGKLTAKAHYDVDGWVLHHNTDLWRGTAPINHSNHGIWMGGSGWLSTHLWEHYLFTQDREFLKNRAYPIIKEAARFYAEFLIEDPNTGWLISTPSNSPENGGLVAGPTMDHQIIRSLLKACVEASNILETDIEFASKLKELIPEIAPNQIGQYGQLQEWMEDKDNPENKHRHVSHLWGMYPGKDINWEENPEMMEAARQSLLFRGDDGTGWSLAWKINFWARCLDGNHAYELIKLLFRFVESDGTSYRKGGSYLNLFDAHPPFQIDGNFGAAAGIVELLIQSHLSTIDLLPALPDEFQTGSISGVCARGGFELDFNWENKQLNQVTVRSKAGEICRLKYGDKTREFETEKGGVYMLDGELDILK